MKQKNYRIVLGVLTVAALSLAGCNSQGDSADKDGAPLARQRALRQCRHRAPPLGSTSDQRTHQAQQIVGRPQSQTPPCHSAQWRKTLGGVGSGTASTGAAGSSGSGATSGSGSSASGDNSLPRQRSGLAINQTAPDSQVGGVCGTVYGATIHAGVETSCSLAVHTAMLALAGTHPSRSWTVTA